jgi:ABC-2 type transport system permease protein
VAFAILGLYFYNALFAAVLATMQGIESSAKFQGYFFMLPMMPMLFLAPLLRDPEAGWLVVVSQLPPLSPTLLPVRIALGAAQPWEIALGLALLALGGWWMRGVAGRIFRLGMLMYGKDPTLPEILRWMRAR